MNIIKSTLAVVCFLLPTISFAQTSEQFVSSKNTGNAFVFTQASVTVPMLVDSLDYAGVLHASHNLKEDIGRVTGKQPGYFLNTIPPHNTQLVVIGTVGKSSFIDRLIKENKLDGKELAGKHEKHIITTIENPLEGIDKALVIAGSDKRGTIYGIYELSNQIGVSPWYYWADVPVKKQTNLYIIPGIYTDGEPAVKYRGIFLNDEAPALSGWSSETFGGFNSNFYEKVFELILRLKGNLILPAMWGNAFYDDDPANGLLADEMGIVTGTSHHEPLGRAHDEWKRYGSGAWDYNANANVLTDFWTGGMERMKHWESVVTIGMRGDGDEAMSESTNIALLEKIIKGQRTIISKVTGKKATETPQVWALYKEVQDYYDKGMRVPDDIILLLCDDNWGNVRKLPELTAKPRKGGYGMYYHFDYVGGPRNYKWLNVSQVQRIWEQMNLTYRYGVKELWVVNVGDLKPMEYPIQFFLDMAWNPNRYHENNLLQHTEEFCIRQFGGAYGKEVARLINLYTQYNRRVTPELLNENTYSLHNYDEFKTVTDEYKALLLDALKLNYLLPQEAHDAYDQLVLFPIYACVNLYEMYYAVAMNKDLAEKNDPEANGWADKARELYVCDSLLTLHYNKEIADGKWNHIMDQTHIGYTYWQQPSRNVMPEIQTVPLSQTASLPPVFLESERYVSIEAEHYARANEGNAGWMVIPNLGKTLSGVTTTPVSVNPDKDTYLEYEMELSSTGEIKLEVLVSPTLNFNANRGLRYSVAFDNGEEQIVNINKKYTKEQMEKWQANSINSTITIHVVPVSGKHTLRFRALDPGIVLQKILIDTGGLKPSYLGASESKIKK